MKNVISEQQLQQQIEQLPDSIAPQRDLWPGIEKAINHQTAAEIQTGRHEVKFTSGLAWAASVLVAVTLTWLTITPSSQQQQASNVAQSMQSEFVQQKQQLLVSFGNPDVKQLPPAMQQQLQQLAAARKTINNALKDDPNNTDLLNLLRFTQQQELNLITQLYQPTWQTI